MGGKKTEAQDALLTLHDAGDNIAVRRIGGFLKRTLGLFFLLVLLSASLALTQSRPHPKIVALENHPNGIQPILTGPPETVTMKSGYVILDPGKSVGKHSTEDHEEILIVLEGHGAMLFRDGSKLDLQANSALYCPPHTEHDVTNTGSSILRYVYVVAKAE